VVPKNAITKQYQKLFELDGVKLTFRDEAVHAVAHRAMERKTGARGLRAIMESIMMNAMYEVPSDDEIAECIITEAAAKEEEEPLLITKDDKQRMLITDKHSQDEIA
jgi:ATP-dependent Clp protease ATP-binding subunit ClpX